MLLGLRSSERKREKERETGRQRERDGRIRGSVLEFTQDTR
jgi:hypothetical protein